MPHPIHTMSEPCEHVFGKVIRCKREAVVQEFVEIVEKLKILWTAMCESNYFRGRSTKNGCGPSYKNFLVATMVCSTSPGTEDIIDIDHTSSEADVIQW